MYWADKHVLCCTASHCAQKGANEVAGKLRLELRKRGLDDHLFVNTCGSIDLCDLGPNLVVYPDGIIYREVTTKDIPAIVDHLTGGPPVERLIVSASSPDELQRQRFYATACAHDEPLAVLKFQNLAAGFGFDEAWIAEQKRRGFIAEKPGETESTVVVTTKARDRYRVPR